LQPKEVILVDDCSDDDTLKKLYRLQATHPGGWIKVITLAQNTGPATARNMGWEAATQPYIAFLDSDDAWHPRKIEIQYGWMRAHPGYGLVGHAHLLLDDNDHEWLGSVADAQTYDVSKIKSLLSNPLATRTVMLKRDLPFRFKAGKRYIEDYLLWLQIIISGIPTAFIDQPLAATYKADFGVGGLSAQLWEMEKGELDTYRQIYREGGMGVLLMLLCMTCSLAKYVRRVLYVTANQIKSWLVG
jgi:glycosyltransferase involved in cell wall biosynthesis